MLTKKIGVDDDVGDTDAENIVAEYKDQEGIFFVCILIGKVYFIFCIHMQLTVE